MFDNIWKIKKTKDIRIGPNIVTDPAMLITRTMEDHITWSDGSKIKAKVLTYNNERDDYDLLWGDFFFICFCFKKFIKINNLYKYHQLINSSYILYALIHYSLYKLIHFTIIYFIKMYRACHNYQNYAKFPYILYKINILCR